MSALISATWLLEHLHAADTVVLDATVYLPTETKQARAEYLTAHLAGARFFDIDQVADPDTALPHMVPSAGRFAKLVGQLGIDNHQHVIFYDQKGLFSAARGWWLFQLFGHQRVSVLDGGLPQWRGVGGPTEAGDGPSPPALTYVPCFNARMLRGAGDVLRNLRSAEEIVLDARSTARFECLVPEARAGVERGHIPGSRSLPFERLLNAPDQTMKSPAELRALFAAAGVDGTCPVITSCGSGITAAVLTLGLVTAGLPMGSLYDGSWAEWGSRPDTPKSCARHS